MSAISNMFDQISHKALLTHVTKRLSFLPNEAVGSALSSSLTVIFDLSDLMGEINSH